MTIAANAGTTVLVVEGEESFVDALTTGLKCEGFRGRSPATESRPWRARIRQGTKTLDVHINRLRAKVESDLGSQMSIVTVRNLGLGYKFERPARTAASN